MKDDALVRRGFVKTFGAIVLTLLLTCAAANSVSLANPFAPIAKNHWVYDALKGFYGYSLGKSYVEDRVRLGETITYFDLALWVGDVLTALANHATAHGLPDAGRSQTLSALVEAYNGANPHRTISAAMAASLREMIIISQATLEVLGYVMPPDVSIDGSGTRLTGFAAAFEDFRVRGESSLRVVDVDEYDPEKGDVEHGVILQQDYRLQVSTPVSPAVRLGAELAGGTNLWRSGGMLDLASASVDIGVLQSIIARIGRVSGHGLSELAVGGVDELAGLRAGISVGQLGSTLLLATYGDDSKQTDGQPTSSGGVVTAWDGTLQVNDRLHVGATLAHREDSPPGGEAEAENTVIRLGGSYSVSPQLIVSGEMAKSSGGDVSGQAVKIGAVLHPLPELTVGAFLLTSGAGYQSIFDGSGGRSSRIDLSAAVGRWILSLRRQNIYQTAESADEATRSVTRLALEFPIFDNASAAASHERGSTDGVGGADAGVKTALDLEVHFDRGKVSLGYVLEDIKDATQKAGQVRTTTASVEHAVGPIGKATAGFSIVDQEQGSETSSNVGLVYEFDNASVSLKYEIFNEIGDRKRNVTSAEVTIKF